MIFIGDLFDLLFSSIEHAMASASRFLELLGARLRGKRLVFLAGNHDYYFVLAQQRARVQMLLAGEHGEALGETVRGLDALRRFLQRRLPDVEIDIRYPTYTFAGVLCTHGHYLDVHARRAGSRADRLLGRAIWSISVGERHMATVEDYEATTALLTGLLFTIAQLPNGTNAERRAYQAFQALGGMGRLASAPARAVERIARLLDAGADGGGEASAREAEYRGARSRERERRRRTGAPAGGEASSDTLARRLRPSDPLEAAVVAFETVVKNLGWGSQTDRIVFAHTHQPLDGVAGPSGSWRYWNTGSWIYEPDLSSQRAYADYVRRAWPGTAVLIDSEEPQPRFLRLREQPNLVAREAAGAR